MNDKQQQVERHLKEIKKQSRKQKLREARRKVGSNYQVKKPRQKKFTPADWNECDDLEEIGFESFQMILPRGEHERRREIEKRAFRGAGDNSRVETVPLEELDTLENTHTRFGLVVEAGSGMCRVEVAGEIVLCDLRGTIKEAQTGYVNVIAVGDQVLISLNGSAQGVVETVLPRRNVLARPYSPDIGKTSDLKQIVVANIDQLLIVASWREPYIWPALIDRYLITAQRNHIEAVICINKIDLIEDQAEFEAITKPYQDLGYHLFFTSVVSETGLVSLHELLSDATTVLAGLSGVGKSSLLTAIQPDLNLKTGQVSDHGLFTGQGRHTTSQSKLWKLNNGGMVIDTPGVRSFGVAGIKPSELAGWYPEMASFIQNCRFGNCSHINEPDCAVKSAVEMGALSDLRYKNYTQIYEELSTS
jgi:ribosome biogenesis GTPase